MPRNPPFAKLLFHQVGDSQQDGGVRIMAAGMHIALRFRAVISDSFFNNRQGIHIRPDCDRRAIAGADTPDNAGFPDTGANIESADLAQCIGHQGRCTHFLERQFGMPVNLAAQTDQFI